MRRHNVQRQRGFSLVVGMVMMILITVMVVAAYTLSITNIKSVGNMQLRNEVIAAANKAIEEVVSTEFPANFAMTANVNPSTFDLDINNDGTTDYTVQLGTLVGAQWFDAVCIQSKPIAAATAGDQSGDDLCQHKICTNASGVEYDCSTGICKGDASLYGLNSAIFDIKATVTDSISGASTEVHEGVRVELSDAQKTAMCP